MTPVLRKCADGIWREVDSPALFDESEAWKTRVKPATVYKAADLPFHILWNILRRHNPADTFQQTHRMMGRSA
jgi:hypothetical protein